MAKLGDKTDFSYRVKRVTKVVDGDTIDVILDMGFNILFAQRVRLFGIDTPESRTRDLVEKKYGLKAKKFLQDKLKKAKSITIRTHKGEEKGKFGRILGDIYCRSHRGRSGDPRGCGGDPAPSPVGTGFGGR